MKLSELVYWKIKRKGPKLSKKEVNKIMSHIALDKEMVNSMLRELEREGMILRNKRYIYIR